MTLSDLSIKRPVFAWMLMFGLIVFGAISLGRLGVSQMPDVDFPVLNINVSWPGAAPEVMEAAIVDKLEQAVISVQGVRDISSTMRQGQANITMEFELNRDVDAALQEVQASISRIRLPKDVDPPTINKTNPDDQPIMWLGISSARSLHDLIVYIDSNLRDQFQIVSGVGEIMLGGFTDRNLRLWVDNEKLKKYELTILDIQNAIAAEHTEVAAGYMENDKQELNIRVMGEGQTPEEVGNIQIKKRGGAPIYDSTICIKDIARVEDGLNDIRRTSLINGKPGVGLGIKKQRGSNAVEVSKAVRKRIKEIEKVLPKDIQIGVNFDSTRFIEDSVHETEFTLFLSAIVTGLICWLFLGSWNSTFNVLMSIPTSIVGTFTVLYFMGFTLNFFTLLGLALAIGIVVDDAIMVLENIVRHMEMGKDKVNAARDGAREITFAAIAASIAVIAIFLPVAFMQGAIGRFFFQFGVTISAAVALSLLEAVTLTPMRCAQFMTTHEKSGKFVLYLDQQFTRLANEYRKLLSWCLDRRWTVIVSSVIFFVISISIFSLLNKELIPKQDMDAFVLELQTPVGSSLTFTSQRIAEAEKILRGRTNEVVRTFGAVGNGDVNRGILFATLKPKSERKVGQYELMDWCTAEMSKIEGMKKVTSRDLSMRGFTAKQGKPVEFNIRGGDYEVLKQKSDEIIKKLEQTGLVTGIDTDFRRGMPEMRIWPDRDQAAASGVSIQDIADTINVAIGGIRQGDYTHDGRRYDVRIRLNPEERLKPEDVEKLQIRTSYGELIPMKNVIRFETVPSLQSISRQMRERSITVSASIAAGKSQAKALDAVEKIGKEVLPEGYRLFFSGSSQTFKEAGTSLLFAFVVGILVAYMVLASQFNSFLHPVTVLLALPFGISGGLIALFVTNQSLNLYSAIGLILLAGIVKKNSILLVEFTNHVRSEGKVNIHQALLTAGPIRLRPILMTSCATIAAAVPPALALGPGAESRIPMAICVIGGVIVSTFLTLVVVPCAYSLFSRFEKIKPEKAF